jgi:hypothetical protein
MAFQEQDTGREVPGAAARSGSVSHRTRRLRGPAGLMGLAAGALCLVAACGTSTSPGSTPVASGPSATPTQSASQPSSPDPTSQPASSPSTGSSGTVTSEPASSSQVAAFTAAAAGKCGFTIAADTLTNAKVTNNGWGAATVTARNPEAQGNASMVFKLGSSWSYVTCGSSFDSGTIPQDVLTALGL